MQYRSHIQFCICDLSDHINQNMLLAFQAGGCLLLYESSAESSKIQIKMSFQTEICLKGADGMANSVDLSRSSLIWVCTVCQGLSIQKLRTITGNF